MSEALDHHKKHPLMDSCVSANRRIQWLEGRKAELEAERDALLRVMREGGCRDCDDLAAERDAERKRAEKWEWIARYLVADRWTGIHPDPAAFADKDITWEYGEQVLTALMPVAVAHVSTMTANRDELIVMVRGLKGDQ